MPLSPSMKVIRLLQEAVFMKAGSYVIKPKSSSDVLIWRRSMALMVPFSMGRSYCLPVRLSVMVKLFPLMASLLLGWVPGGLQSRLIWDEQVNQRPFREGNCSLATTADKSAI